MADPARYRLSRQSWALIFAGTGLLLIFLLLTLIPLGRTTFSLSARTEIVELHTGRANVPRWYLPPGQIARDGGPVQDWPGGAVAIGPEVLLRAERIGSGSLDLTLDRQPGVEAPGEATARFFDAADQPLGTADAVRLRLPVIAPLLLPVAGAAWVGALPASQTRTDNPALLQGHVAMYARALIGRERFPLSTFELMPADRVALASAGHAGALGAGILRIDADGAMQISFHAAARNVQIERFGSTPYRIRPSFWSRLAADPMVQALAGILLFLQAFIVVLLQERLALERPARG